MLLGTTTKSLDRLVACLLDTNKSKMDGYTHVLTHTKVTVEEVYLHFRALLASRCLGNSDLILALAGSLSVDARDRFTPKEFAKFF
jgi:hypothetical protein